MARPKLFLHVGTHKTGTTSIQNVLDAWSDRLFAAAGILYPSVGRAASAPRQHLSLALAYAERHAVDRPFAPHAALDTQTLIAALKHEISMSGAQTVVLSSEEFWWRREIIEPLAQDFSDFDIVPVMYVRDYAEVVEGSHYTSAVYGENLDADMAPSYLRNSMPKLVSRWAAIAADGKAVVVNYHALDNGDSVGRMLEIIGAPQSLREEVRASPVRHNVSVSVLEIVARRALCRGGVPDGFGALEAQLRRLPHNRDVTTLAPEARDALKRKFVRDMNALGRSRHVAGFIFDADAYRAAQAPGVHVTTLPELLRYLALNGATS